MPAFLMLWNGTPESWPQLGEDALALRQGKTSLRYLSIPDSVEVPRGASVYVVRCGTKAPSGIVAHGRTAAPPPQLHSLPIRLDSIAGLAAKDVLTQRKLADLGLASVSWRGGGILKEVEPSAVARLARAWKTHLGRQQPGATPESEREQPAQQRVPATAPGRGRTASSASMILRMRLKALARSDQFDADRVASMEGLPRARMVTHLAREKGLRLRKIAHVLRISGALRCEVPGCAFDFNKTYGEIGFGFAHVHHRQPLSVRGAGKTRLNDLAILCANCHAMIHRRGLALRISDLQIRK